MVWLEKKCPASAPPFLNRCATEKPLDDARLQALSSFTGTLLSRRGRLPKDELQVFLAAGFSERHVLEILFAISVKTISNYTNHLFDIEVDQPFAPYCWQPMISA